MGSGAAWAHAGSGRRHLHARHAQRGAMAPHAAGSGEVGRDARETRRGRAEGRGQGHHRDERRQRQAFCHCCHVHLTDASVCGRESSGGHRLQNPREGPSLRAGRGVHAPCVQVCCADPGSQSVLPCPTASGASCCAPSCRSRTARDKLVLEIFALKVEDTNRF